MKCFKIGTWNLEDFKLVSKRRKAYTLLQLLEKENLDILALQNVSNSLVVKIYEVLEDTNYHLDRNVSLMPTNLVKSNYVIIKNDYLFTSQIKRTCDVVDKEEKSCVTNLNIVDVRTKEDKIKIINATLVENKRKITKFKYIADRVNEINEENNGNLVLTGNLDDNIETNGTRKIKKYLNVPNEFKILNDISKLSYIPSYMITSNETTAYDIEVKDGYSKVYSNKPFIAKIVTR